MSTYRLKIKYNTAQFELVAKSGNLIAYELDRYLESFLNRKVESAPLVFKKTEPVYQSVQPQQVQQVQQVQQAQQTQQVQYDMPMPKAQETPQEHVVHVQTTNIVQEQPKVEEQSVIIRQQTFNQNIENTSTEGQFAPQQTTPTQENFAASAGQNTTMSLGDFLAINKSGDVFSEFIISAYYYKHVLNIPSFSIKMLNSKFYPSTGTLIDLSIVDEARARGFIDIIEEDGMLKYTLSANGETYFINQLRG